MDAPTIINVVCRVSGTAALCIIIIIINRILKHQIDTQTVTLHVVSQDCVVICVCGCVCSSVPGRLNV